MKWTVTVTVNVSEWQSTWCDNKRHLGSIARKHFSALTKDAPLRPSLTCPVFEQCNFCCTILKQRRQSIHCCWRYCGGWGADAERATVAVYNCSKSLYHQLYRVFLHYRIHRCQSLPVRLLAQRLRQGVYSASHRHRCRLDVAGRSRTRLTEPLWLVVALVRHQDSEVSVGPHGSLPLHHPLRRRRHAAAVHRHRHLLLAHLRSHSTCQAATSQNTVSGKTQDLVPSYVLLCEITVRVLYIVQAVAVWFSGWDTAHAVAVACLSCSQPA